MKRYIYKILYLVLSIMVLTSMMSLLVYAGEGATKYQNSLKDIATSIAGIATALIVVSAVVTAILYMSSFANAKNREMAKYSLYALIVGVFMLAMYNDIASWIYNLIGADPTKIDVAMKTKVGIKQAKYADGTIVSGDGTVISSGSSSSTTGDSNNPEMKDTSGNIITKGGVYNTIKASDIPADITNQYSSKTLDQLLAEKKDLVSQITAGETNNWGSAWRGNGTPVDITQLELKLYAVNAAIAKLQVEDDSPYYVGGHLDTSNATVIQYLYDNQLVDKLNIYQLMVAHDNLVSGNIDLNKGYWSDINKKYNECLRTNGDNGVVPADNFKATNAYGVALLYYAAPWNDRDKYLCLLSTNQLKTAQIAIRDSDESKWGEVLDTIVKLIASRETTSGRIY